MFHNEEYLDSELQTESKLVFHIWSKNDRGLLTHSLFVTWDNDNEDYMIRGRRYDIDERKTTNYTPFAFHAGKSRHVYDYIETIMGNAAELSIKLYNYNNILHYEYDDITFDFLEGLLNHNYELVSYTDDEISKRSILKSLKLLRRVYNWESFDH
jgi:hypothetical protein